MSAAEKSTNMLAYSREGTLSHLSFDEAAWPARVQEQFATAVQDDALALLREIYNVSTSVRVLTTH